MIQHKKHLQKICSCLKHTFNSLQVFPEHISVCQSLREIFSFGPVHEYRQGFRSTCSGFTWTQVMTGHTGRK